MKKLSSSFWLLILILWPASMVSSITAPLSPEYEWVETIYVCDSSNYMYSRGLKPEDAVVMEGYPGAALCTVMIPLPNHENLPQAASTPHTPTTSPLSGLGPSLPVLGVEMRPPPLPPPSLLSKLRGSYLDAPPPDPMSNAGLDILGDLRAERMERDRQLINSINYYRALAAAERAAEYRRRRAEWNAKVEEWDRQRREYMVETSNELEATVAENVKKEVEFKRKLSKWEEDERAKNEERREQLEKTVKEWSERNELEGQATDAINNSQLKNARLQDGLSLARLLPKEDRKPIQVADWLWAGYHDINGFIVRTSSENHVRILGSKDSPDLTRDAISENRRRLEERDKSEGTLIRNRLVRESKKRAEVDQTQVDPLKKVSDPDELGAVKDAAGAVGEEAVEETVEAIVKNWLKKKGRKNLARLVGIAGVALDLLEPSEIGPEPPEFQPGTPQFEAAMKKHWNALINRNKHLILDHLDQNLVRENQRISVDLKIARDTMKLLDDQYYDIRNELGDTDPRVDDAMEAYADAADYARALEHQMEDIKDMRTEIKKTKENLPPPTVP